MQLCIKCREKSVFVSNKISFCKGHFNEYIFGKSVKILKKYINRKTKILLALSGGKDSVLCFYILNKLGYDFTPVYIDFETDNKNSELIKKLSRYFKREIIFLKSSDYSVNIKKLIQQKSNSNPCVICSTVRRYILNDYAFKNKYEIIATGHNLTDSLNQALSNIKNNFFLGFKNITPFLKSVNEKKLAGRIKPLYLVTDREAEIFVKLNKIPYFKGKCIYFKGFFFKKYINLMEKENQSVLLNMTNSLVNFSILFDKIKTNIEIPERICKLCGYPSTDNICSFCKITKK